MQKRLVGLFFAIGVVLSGFMSPGVAALASVNYLHDTILELKNVTVPQEPLVNGTMVSMKYFMRQIDKANQILNGTATTNYENELTSANERNLVEVNRVRMDVEELIQAPSFTVKLGNHSGMFDFQISAAGYFKIDWGDGTAVETINKTNTTNTTYSHTYSSTGDYDLTITGLATAYNSTVYSTPAISFFNSTNKIKITELSDTLGAMFPTLGGGNNHFFMKHFMVAAD